MKKELKVRKVVAVVLVVLIATTLMSAKKPKQKIQMLDWKGSVLGVQIPEWVTKSVDGDINIQTLPEYKDQYCFVVFIDQQDNQDFAVNWVKNLANGAAQVSTMIATTVNSQSEAATSGKKGQNTDQHMSEVRDAMSNSSFNGFRQVADFWAYTNNKSTKKKYYSAWSLWTVPVKQLNDQIAANMQNIVDNNTAMSAAERQIYGEIINDIRTRGIATNVALAE